MIFEVVSMPDTYGQVEAKLVISNEENSLITE